MKWAEKFGWGIGSRLVAAFLKTVKTKQRHEEFEADVLQPLSDLVEISHDLVPYNNHRTQWKQNRIDILMTHNAFYSEAQNNVFVPDSLWGEK